MASVPGKFIGGFFVSRRTTRYGRRLSQALSGDVHFTEPVKWEKDFLEIYPQETYSYAGEMNWNHYCMFGASLHLVSIQMVASDTQVVTVIGRAWVQMIGWGNRGLWAPLRGSLQGCDCPQPTPILSGHDPISLLIELSLGSFSLFTLLPERMGLPLLRLHIFQTSNKLSPPEEATPPQGKGDNFLPQGWQWVLCQRCPQKRKTDKSRTLKRICNLKQVPCPGLSQHPGSPFLVLYVGLCPCMFLSCPLPLATCPLCLQLPRKCSCLT